VANEVEIRITTKGAAAAGAEGKRVARILEREGHSGGRGFSSRFSSGMSAGLGPVRGIVRGFGAAVVPLFAAVGVGAAVAAAGGIRQLGFRIQDLDKKARTVFAGQLPLVRKWAEENKRAFGLSSRETVGLAANFADLLIPMGFTRKEAAAMSTDVVGLAGALSKWSGGTKSTAEVSDILTSAMLGERDALKGLGISITEAEVDARLLKKGQDDLTGAALQQAEAIATQELIMEKSTDAQAAWAKGGKDAAEKQNALKNTVAELKERLATGLTPAIQKLVEWVNVRLPAAIDTLTGKLHEARDWWDENRDSVRVLTDALKLAFLPSSKAAKDSTDKLNKSSADLKKTLTGLLEFMLRVTQGFFYVAIAAGTVRDWVLRLGIGVGLLINAVDRLSGGTGHAADSMVADFRQMRNEGNAKLEEIRRKIRDLQGTIDKLHGKNLIFNMVVRGRVPSPSGGGGHVQLQHGTMFVPETGPAIVHKGEIVIPEPQASRVRAGRETLGGGAPGGGGGAAVLRLEVSSGGSRLDDLLVELLRKSIRSKGGNVQVVLGT